MKNFRVTVNGNIYDVAVEELPVGTIASSAPAMVQSAPVPTVPVAAAAVAPTPVAPAAPVTSSSAPVAAKKITSPMPGTILDIKVKQGDAVSENQVVIILEAMKMENEIVSPFAGKVASINVSKGASVNSGDLLLSIE